MTEFKELKDEWRVRNEKQEKLNRRLQLLENSRNSQFWCENRFSHQNCEFRDKDWKVEHHHQLMNAYEEMYALRKKDQKTWENYIEISVIYSRKL